jgi:NTP pyrophosphatase (non-canonical NTP hydrolase)
MLTGHSAELWLLILAAEAQEIFEKIDSEQIFVISSDSESVLKRISNTSHITHMLTDKIERLE